MFIGESLLSHGDSDGGQIAGEDVRLAHDKGGGWGVQGGKGGRIALFLPLVQLQHSHLRASVLLIPVAVL